jgi:hypothetical protein
LHSSGWWNIKDEKTFLSNLTKMRKEEKFAFCDFSFFSMKFQGDSDEQKPFDAVTDL